MRGDAGDLASVNLPVAPAMAWPTSTWGNPRPRPSTNEGVEASQAAPAGLNANARPACHDEAPTGAKAGLNAQLRPVKIWKEHHMSKWMRRCEVDRMENLARKAIRRGDMAEAVRCYHALNLRQIGG